MAEISSQKELLKLNYEKPLLKELESSIIGNYLFPLNSKETEGLKEIIKEFPETIVDFHSHAGPRKAVKGKKFPETYGMTFLYREIEDVLVHRAILSGIITKQEPHKVYQAVMTFPFYGIDLKETNRWLLEETGKGAGFLPFLIPLPREKGLEETKKALAAGSFFGIAEIHPRLLSSYPEGLRGEKGYLSEKFLELVEKQELPMIIHLPKHLLNHVEELKELSRDYPKLKVVLAHMGLVQVLTERSKSALSEILTLPNIYFDTSTVTDEKVFAHVLRESGVGKILFASDAPYDALRLEVKFIEGKMEVLSSQDLIGTKKVKEEINRMLISSPKALLEAVKEVYPDEEQAKLAKEKIFYQNALEILPRELPPYEVKKI
jgi:predicted TIM-barrel fold metal-dependent hydrolase